MKKQSRFLNTLPPLLGGGLVAFAAYLYTKGTKNKLSMNNFVGSDYRNALVQKLIKEEKPMPRAYKDQAGKDTIGVGHLIRLPDEKRYLSITLNSREIQDLLFLDIARIEDGIKPLIKVPLTKNQQVALASFVFNIGVPRFKSSTMLKLINQGKLREASLEFPRWIYVTINGKKQVSEGLRARRLREQALFNN